MQFIELIFLGVSSPLHPSKIWFRRVLGWVTKVLDLVYHKSIWLHRLISSITSLWADLRHLLVYFLSLPLPC
jgi:hypothetical protein